MREEKHGRGDEQPAQMLETFGSVGVHSFDVTQTDWDGRKSGFRPAQRWEALRLGLAEMVESAIQRQRNLIVRPRGATTKLVQLDDVSASVADRLEGSALLTLRTSPKNYQVWIAVPECSPGFVRRLRQGCGADPSASGATRVAGSVNFKRKYAPDFPSVNLERAAPGRTVNPAKLEELGLVAGDEPNSFCRPARVSLVRQTKRWPSYERCLLQAPLAHGSERPDVSRADFTFCLLAIDWGWSVEETSECLLQRSRKAQQNGESYARRTAERAAAAISRRSLNVRSKAW
jgi:RepB DNA-primase from phage plasmid